MIMKSCYFGLDVIIKSVLERLSKNGVKSVDQRSPPVSWGMKPVISLELR